MSALAQGFGAQQITGAGLLLGCVIFAVAAILSRHDNRHR